MLPLVYFSQELLMLKRVGFVVCDLASGLESVLGQLLL